MYADVEFVAETFYDLEIHYSHKIGPHKLRLLWESDTMDYQVIPASNLFYKLCS